MPHPKKSILNKQGYKKYVIFRNQLKSAFLEVRQIEQGLKKGKTLNEFLKELEK